MNLIIFLVYLQGIISDLAFALCSIAVLLALAAAVITVECKDKSPRPYFTASLVLLALSIFLPSKDSINVLIGVQVTTEISETLNNSDLGKKALSAINMKLDEMVSPHDNQK